MKFLLAVTTILFFVGIALADCATRSRPVVAATKFATVVTPTVTKVITPAVYHDNYAKVVTEVIPVAVYQPLAVAVPVYGGAYVPPAGYAAPQHAPQASSNDMQQILQALKVIDERLKVVENKQPPTQLTPVPPAPIPVKPNTTVDPFQPKNATSLAAPDANNPALAVLQNKCASCHDAKVSGEKGGGFTLTNGPALAKLDDRQARKVATRSYAGTMPPKDSGVSLTDQEVAQIQAFIDTLK